ncbi:EamA family transporter [Ectopseudomonas alcaliphila]|uniref:EamA family transporter n=1 Tax=Ectopseudomonas alcaliphila TaxID=101564 RepID=UPI0027842EB7|nr:MULTISPECIES: EamA family transporter [Pseudomonas]MDP9939178.1 O-acetylserine/cysteine efflux transporter [Pseudomonas sp. 3400]MDR7011401.1 O-acetylserine/cysteine efflux transporter [Pseudomonas alcaliphila]
MKANHLLLALLVTAIWGLNFSVIKLGLQSVDPFILAGMRFTLCALPLVFFLRFPQVGIGYVVTYGLLFGVCLWAIVNLGIQAGLSAGIASLVLQFSAFFTILLGALLFRESISKYQYAGIAIALLGLALIISITDGTVTLAGVALVIFGALSWSLANILIKKSGAQEVFAFLVWSSLFSPIPLFLIAYLQHGANIYAQTLAQIDNTAIFSILFQVYPTTLIGYWIWNSLLKTYPVSTVAPLSLLVPVFGLLGSTLIFSEQIGLAKSVAAGLIILGLAVGLYGKQFVAAIQNYAQRSQA